MPNKLQKRAEADIPTALGTFRLIAFSEREEDYAPHLAIIKPWKEGEAVNVRLHSECLTGDILGSLRCDCGEQLHMALAYIAKHSGVVIYLRQEGRGIGLVNKLRSYRLQDRGLNTVEANVHLGFEPDERSYEIAVQILKGLGIDEINFLTNNPDKIKALEDAGVKLKERIPIEVKAGEENKGYLEAKQKLMGHLFRDL